MALPGLDQYQLALQNPRTSFDDPDLKVATVETTPMGLPKVISGGFALAYHLSNRHEQWAIRCFHRDTSDLEKRYAAISKVIASSGSAYLIPVEYLSRGVLVNGTWYPITKMPWVNGVPINRFIEANLTLAAIDRLLTNFNHLLAELQLLGLAHGDLQHGNILVEPNGNLKLVDYDGMFAPSLRGLQANESGHPNYQHPFRDTQFDLELDRFSALVITVALEALRADTGLWNRHSNGDNLLFKQADFHTPDSSSLFSELTRIATVNTHAERLRSVCLGEYHSIPTLADFLAGTFTISPRKVVAPPPVRQQFIVLAASDIAKLLKREGDVVTVVGQITAVHQALTRYRQPYAFLNFGDWRSACFTLVLWKEALDLFEKLGADVEDLDGEWVSVTGLITSYRRYRTYARQQPQMVINMPSEIQAITASQAKDILGGRTSPPVAPATNGAPVKKETADALNRLYGKFPSVPARTPAGVGRRRGGVGTAARRKYQTTYSSQQYSQKRASSRCFVATAVYQDIESADVQALRRFRDLQLAENIIGRIVIRCYWIVGPKAAAVVIRFPILRPPLRWLLSRIARRVK